MLFLHTFFNTLIFLKKGEKKCEKLFLYYTSECYSHNYNAYKAVVVAISTLTFLQGRQYLLYWWQSCYQGVEGGDCLSHTYVSALLLQTSRSSIHHF